ncbi:hypothetical protein AB7078_17330 [Proteus mirabilis]|uniref:hypothetical protein n=1 Tax=Proteus mirabilis TaxID=584 RepID=UPI0034E37C1E
MRKFHLIIIMICFHLVSIQAANAESILISTAKLVCEDKETPELVKKCKLMVYKIGESSFNLGKATAACELAKKNNKDYDGDQKRACEEIFNMAKGFLTITY